VSQEKTGVKSKSSDMVRLPNDMIESVKKLNELFRSGQPDEVVQGLYTLIAALEKREAIATYNSIDVKLGAIVERLNQLEQRPPVAAPIVPQVQQPSAVAAAPVPKLETRQPIAPSLPQVQPTSKPPAPTVMIWLDHDSFAAHSFDVPGGEKRLKMGAWQEIPESWLPKIREQVKLSSRWGMPGFKLEIAG
jgi:hypothetical protein